MTTPLCSQPRRDNHSPPVPASPGLTGCLGYREEASLFTCQGSGPRHLRIRNLSLNATQRDECYQDGSEASRPRCTRRQPGRTEVTAWPQQPPNQSSSTRTARPGTADPRVPHRAELRASATMRERSLPQAPRLSTENFTSRSRAESAFWPPPRTTAGRPNMANVRAATAGRSCLAAALLPVSSSQVRRC